MRNLILLPQPYAAGALATPSPNQCLLQIPPRHTFGFLPLLNKILWPAVACSIAVATLNVFDLVVEEQSFIGRLLHDLVKLQTKVCPAHRCPHAGIATPKGWKQSDSVSSAQALPPSQLGQHSRQQSQICLLLLCGSSQVRQDRHQPCASASEGKVHDNGSEPATWTALQDL